mmetsp:Transcript_142334/g.248203  ORF Transcript_142334/g.248203 Transcript_142334/m.248203 type:complete len:115 (-) Transcript_142334:413-757(-)
MNPAPAIPITWVRLITSPSMKGACRLVTDAAQPPCPTTLNATRALCLLQTATPDLTPTMASLPSPHLFNPTQAHIYSVSHCYGTDSSGRCALMYGTSIQFWTPSKCAVFLSYLG